MYEDSAACDGDILLMAESVEVYLSLYGHMDVACALLPRRIAAGVPEHAKSHAWFTVGAVISPVPVRPHIPK